ncbi:MAG: PilN domain-containing protein [Oscillospiraceae bacterium]
MKKDSGKFGIVSLLQAVVLAALILVGTLWGAEALADSTLFTQSRILREIMSEESLDFTAILTDADRRTMLQHFIGGVTNAYVSFEMIPLNEGKTLEAIFSSLSDEIFIEKFEYHRRDLTLTGYAENSEACEAFVNRLESTGYFASVEIAEQTEGGEGGRTNFVVECGAKEQTGGFLGIEAQPQ